MGTTLSLDLVNFVSKDILALETAVSVQLASNHYPPIPQSFIPACLKAIELANQGEWEGWVELPAGVTDATSGLTSTTAQKLIDWAHLGFFVTSEDDPLAY